MSRATRAAIWSRLRRFMIAPPVDAHLRNGAQAGSNTGPLDRNHTLDENTGSNHGLGVQLTEFDDLVYLRNSASRSRGHDRTEIAGGLAVDQISPAVRALGLDQSEVGM